MNSTQQSWIAVRLIVTDWLAVGEGGGVAEGVDDALAGCVWCRCASCPELAWDRAGCDVVESTTR